MTRRAAKIDANQSEIVAALRDAGVMVHPAHAMGDGFPDLVCGFRGRITLVEIKDGSKPPSGQKLTEAQEKFHAEWREYVAVANSIESAFEAVGVVAK